MKASFLAVVLAASLAACGGGGDVQVPDYSASINAALPAVAAAIPKMPPPTYNPALPVVPNAPSAQPYTGGDVVIFGINGGFMPGTSPQNVAENIAKAVVDNPVKFSIFYKEMLGDQGLKITVSGKVFVAKLTNAGVVVTGG